jgi:hypothetical protein
MNTIEIKKRNSEEVACWRVNAENVTPNTLVCVDQGLTAMITIDGVTKIQMGGSSTVHGLLNPGKKNKWFGGDKPYNKVVIYAVDQASEYAAEWGLAGPSAIPCRDEEYNVDCTAIAVGEYYYKIADFVNFFNTIPMDGNEQITRDSIREYLRGETMGIIKSYLSSKLNQLGLPGCQAKLYEFSEDLKEEINRHLRNKGLSVYNFSIAKFSYDLNHNAARKNIDGAKLEVVKKKIVNDGRLDDVTVDKAKRELDVDYIKAMKGKFDEDAPRRRRDDDDDDGVFIICPRCGEKNNKSNYCKKCGEKLRK